MSVRLSVYLSVCLSQADIVSKRLNISSKTLSLLASHTILFFRTKRYVAIFRRVTQSWRRGMQVEYAIFD